MQVREEVHYTYEGHYAVKITRIRDGKVLIDFTDPNIDMWRIGSSYIRSKFGLYRSLAGGRLDQDPVGQSPLLKNESLWITDFKGGPRRIRTRHRACLTTEHQDKHQRLQRADFGDHPGANRAALVLPSNESAAQRLRDRFRLAVDFELLVTVPQMKRDGMRRHA